MAKKASERFVLVTTKHRGVFSGFLVGDDGDKVTLRECRNCVYWPASVKGFLGLAKEGPLQGSRVGKAAPLAELRDVTCVADVTDEAKARWESEPWS